MTQGAQFHPLPGESCRRVAGRQGLYLGGKPCVEHLAVPVLGKDRIHVDVAADAPQFLDLLALAEQEPVGVEGRLQPRPVKLGHVHAELQLGAIHRNQARGKHDGHLTFVIVLFIYWSGRVNVAVATPGKRDAGHEAAVADYGERGLSALR